METIVIPAPVKYWYERTDEQIDNLRELDRRMGTTLDSAGEPKIYNRIASAQCDEPLICTVLKTRGVSWNAWTWHKKPTYLIEVIATINNVPRIIKVRDPRKVKK